MDLKNITKHKFFYPITIFIVLFIVSYWYKKTYQNVENFQNKYDKAIVSWVKVGNKMKQVEFGYDPDTKKDLVIGINDNDVFMYYDNTQVWKTFLDTDLNQICARNKNAVIGLNREGVLFGSENVFSGEPTWTRFDNHTNAPRGINIMNVGFDGLLIVVVKNKLFSFQLPTSGALTKDKFNEIYTHSKDIIDIDIKDKDNIYFIDTSYILHKFSLKDGYQQLGTKGYKNISVGNDGSLWAIDNTVGNLWMFSASNEWEKVGKSSYIDVDAKNSNNIIAITDNHEIMIGSVSGFPKISTPIETPFQVIAYSGGHNGHSSVRQNTTKPSIELQVEYNDIISGVSDAGLHVVSINEYGQLLNHNVYNKNNMSKLSVDFSSMLGDKTSVTLPNLVSGFHFDKVIRGNQTEYYKILNKFKNEIEYTSKKEYAGYFKSNIRAYTKYKISFNYETDGEFMIDYTGANEDALPNETLPTTVGGSVYEKIFTSTVGGELRLYLKNTTASSTKMRDVSITELSDVKSDSELIFFMVQTSIYEDEENRLSDDVLRFFEDFGYLKLRSLKKGTSYVSVLDARRKFVIFEDAQDNSDVLFNSEGKTPIIDAIFNKAKIGSGLSKVGKTEGDKYLIHKKESILWSISDKKVLQENAIPNIPNLPTPFNQKIDAVLDLDNVAREVLFFRGNLYLKFNTVTEKIVSEPAIIGKGMDFKFTNSAGMPSVNYRKFLNGIDASVTFNGNAILFRGNQYARYNLLEQKVTQWGLMTDSKSIYSKLPDTFKQKIDASVNKGTVSGLNQYYLFSRDKWILMDDSNGSIVTGPHSLVTHPDFNKLPLRFRVNVGDLPPEPFLNHSRFKKNEMTNYDISVVDGGMRGLSGWNKRNVRNTLIKRNGVDEILPAYNTEVIYNFEKLPVAPEIYREFLRKELQENSFKQQELDNINNVLRYYHQIGESSKHQVKRFGGNSVSFSLLPTIGGNDNGRWASKGMRTKMNPGCFYNISIYVKTTDKFSIRPYLSYTNDKLVTKENHDMFSYLEISNKDGWQQLNWNIQLDTKVTYNDVSFEYYQKTKEKAVHSLYGPYVKPVLGYLDQGMIDDLTGNTVKARTNSENAMVVLENTNGKYLQGRRNGNGSFTMNSCNGSTCSQIKGVKLGLEKFKISKRANSRSKYIISHGYLTTTRNKGSERGGAVHMSVDKQDNVTLSENVDISTEFYILVDLSGNIMFLHVDSNKFISIGDNGMVYAISSKGNPEELLNCKFRPHKISNIMEGFANPDDEMEHMSYIDALVPMDYKHSNLVYMFRNDDNNKLFYCVYDISNKGWVTSTTVVRKGTKFARLPSNDIAEMRQSNYWEGETKESVEKIANKVSVGSVARISNMSFKSNIDAVLPILQDSRIVYIFNGSYCVIWYLDTDN